MCLEQSSIRKISFSQQWLYIFLMVPFEVPKLLIFTKSKHSSYWRVLPSPKSGVLLCDLQKVLQYTLAVIFMSLFLHSFIQQILECGEHPGKKILSLKNSGEVNAHRGDHLCVTGGGFGRGVLEHRCRGIHVCES